MTNTPNPTDETITELARWLFTIEYSYFTNSDDIVYISANGDRRRFVISDIPKWIKSAEGLEAVENAMIERGYNMTVSYINNSQWTCRFGAESWPETIVDDPAAKSKSDAILHAAYEVFNEQR